MHFILTPSGLGDICHFFYIANTYSLQTQVTCLYPGAATAPTCLLYSGSLTTQHLPQLSVCRSMPGLLSRGPASPLDWVVSLSCSLLGP